MPECLSTKTSQMATQTEERFQKVCLCEMKIWMGKQRMQLQLSGQVVATYSTDLPFSHDLEVARNKFTEKTSSAELNV